MFGEERRKSERIEHECELTIEDDTLCKYINSGYFISLRRAFRNWMSIDPNNPRSRTFFKSTFVISREKIRHLNFYYFMIHPFSQFRVFWEIVIIFNILLQLTCAPLFILTHKCIFWYLTAAVDIFLLLDVILSFNEGYQHEISNTIILDRKLVAKHYFLNYFISDAIGFCDYNYILILYCPCSEFSTIWVSWKYKDCFIALRLFRIVTLLVYTNSIKDAKQIDLYLMKLIQLSLIFFFSSLWMLAIVYVVTSPVPPEDLSQNLKLLFKLLRRVFYMLLLCGTCEQPEDMGVLIIEMICNMIGFILYLMTMCQFLQICTKYNWSSKKFYQMMKQLTEYVRYKSLPPHLVSKILNYCDYRFQLNYYQENDIIKILSPQLQKEVMLQAHMHLLSKVPLFEDLPISILFAIILRMRVNFYMPSDVIVTAGTRSDEMFFINSGGVAFYTVGGKEITHMSDGEHFGAISLISENRHAAETAIAIDCCEIYILRRSDFLEEINVVPEVAARVKRYMGEFMARSCMSIEDSSFDTETLKL